MPAECSIVVPVQDEAVNLPALHLRLTAMLRRLAIPYEIIYVDNGSRDQTAELIRDLHAQDTSVRGIVLSRRFNAHAALCAGLDAATGRAVISIDGNLEDPPEVIPQLLEAWHQGYQVVFARRKRDRSLGYRFASRWCRRLLRLASEVAIPTDIGELTLMDRRAVRELNNLPERTRFTTGLRSWVGFRQTILEYEPTLRLPRSKGLGIGRQLRTVLEGLLSFSNAPLHMISVLGALLILAAGGFLIAGGLGASALEHIPWLVLGGMGILGGLQLACLGILGEYMARVYQEVRGRPLYVAEDRIGFQRHPRAVRNVLELLPDEATRRQEIATRRAAKKWTSELTA